MGGPTWAKQPNGRLQPSGLNPMAAPGADAAAKAWWQVAAIPAISADTPLQHDTSREQAQPTAPSALAAALARELACEDDAVVVTDAHGRIVVTSPAFERAIGRAAAASLGQALPSLLRLPPGPAATGILLNATLYPDIGPPVPVQVRMAAIPAAAGSSSAAGSPPGPPAAPYRVTTFKVAARPQTIVAGQLQIELDRVRQASGSRWSSIRERLLQAAHQLIVRRLDPADSVTRMGDGFLIRFAQLDETAASLAAQRIGEDVDRLLAGDPDTAAAASTSFVAEILAGAGQDGAALQQGLALARGSALAHARQLLSAASGTARLDLDPAFNVTGRRAELTFARLRDGLGGKLDRLAWSCTGPQDGDIGADYALLGIGTALAVLATGAAPGGLLMLGVSVQALLQPRASDRLSKLLGGTPTSLRERLVIELTGLRADLPPKPLATLIRLLGGLCKGAGARLPDPGMHDLVHTVVHAMPVISLHADALVSPQLPRLVTMMNAAKVMLVVRHVDSEDALMELYQSGISRMTGTAMGGGDPAH